MNDMKLTLGQEPEEQALGAFPTLTLDGVEEEKPEVKEYYKNLEDS